VGVVRRRWSRPAAPDGLSGTRVWHADGVPEGDTIHRTAERLRVLVGERVEAESPNPRGLATGVARVVDGRRLEAVDAIGKNLLLRFEGGVVLHSHLRMNGRWRVEPRDGRSARRGRPWLLLRGREWEATQWNGPVLRLEDGIARRVGPDLLAPGTRVDEIVSRLRSVDPSRLLGEALVDQRLVAGIGNVWLAEMLWHARVSPWASLAEIGDDELSSALEWARAAMRSAVSGRRSPRAVYRRAGRGCPRCGEPIRSHGLGDANRTAYWCSACQPTRRLTEKEGFEPSRQGFPHLTP
jgi:endonuclease VIII